MPIEAWIGLLSEKFSLRACCRDLSDWTSFQQISLDTVLSQQTLCEMASRNPQRFWRQYKERQSPNCNIPKEQWKASYEALYKARKAPTAALTDDIRQTLVNPPQSPTPDLKAESGPDAPEQAIDLLNA